MSNNTTVESFVNKHRNQNVSIMSPGGYVNIRPGENLAELAAHAGTSDTETVVSWDELKCQVIVGTGTFDAKANTWYVLSECVD